MARDKAQLPAHTRARDRKGRHTARPDRHHDRAIVAAPIPAAPPAMRFSRPLLDTCAAALAEVLKFAYPADAVLSRFFRLHPKVGQRDRATIAESIYPALRRGR